MKRDGLALLVHDAQPLLIFLDVAWSHIAVEGDMGLDYVVPLPAQRIEYDERKAFGKRNLHAFGDVAQHISKDLFSAHDRHPRIFEFPLVAGRTALAVVIVVRRFNELAPEKSEVLLRVV